MCDVARVRAAGRKCGGGWYCGLCCWTSESASYVEASVIRVTITVCVFACMIWLVSALQEVSVWQVGIVACVAGRRG